jgi:hypothetical protein
MEISELTLKLIILLLPGAVSSIIFQKLTVHKKWNSFQFVLNSILFGLSSYLISQLIASIKTPDEDFVKLWEHLQTNELPKASIIIFCLVTSVFVGFLSAGIDNYKLINKIGKFFKFSTKYGDENLYSYFLGSPDINEIFVHDVKNNITYHGNVDAYSETTEIKEIVLRNVKVYNYETSEYSFSISRVYLSMSKDEMVIHVPL